MSKKYFLLSVAADNDLEDIFDYTFNEFGFEQAERYLIEIDAVLKQILENPKIGRSRNELV